MVSETGNGRDRFQSHPSRPNGAAVRHLSLTIPKTSSDQYPQTSRTFHPIRKPSDDVFLQMSSSERALRTWSGAGSRDFGEGPVCRRLSTFQVRCPKQTWVKVTPAVPISISICRVDQVRDMAFIRLISRPTVMARHTPGTHSLGLPTRTMFELEIGI